MITLIESGPDLLAADSVTVSYKLSARSWTDRGPRVTAVHDANLGLRKGEIVALVGESGCGKTSLSKAMAGLVKPTRGNVTVDGEDIYAAGTRERRQYRRNVQMIFQDPYSSLNPRLTAGASLEEPLKAHGFGREDRKSRIAELLELVGMPSDSQHRYPQAFSGGQRQRISIARALALRPLIVIADEPVSALDVSIQAQVLNLLLELRESMSLTLLIVSHDLAVVRQIADRVAVMHLGRIVELGYVKAVFHRPAHPYTRALISAAPLPDPRVERTKQRMVLSGDLPNPVDPPSGCTFRTRCPLADSVCVHSVPELRPIGPSGQVTACHHASYSQ